MGYKLIYNHNLGPSNINHMVYGAEESLTQCTYIGGNRNWTFNKYTNLHKEKQNILKSQKEHDYTVITQQSKVRYFIEVMNTTVLNAVKTCIMSDESLRQDFHGCVELSSKIFKHSSEDNRKSLGVTASTTNNSIGNNSVTFAPKDQYYDSN